MERNMMWGSLALGILGWVCTLLLAQPRNSSSIPDTDAQNGAAFAILRPFLGLALALPLAVWLATLPTHAPFSSGQGWGRGFLLGGIGSWSAFLVVSRATSRPSLHFLALRIAATAPIFASIVVACVPLIWMRHSVIDALMGAGIGWVATTLVLVLGQNETSTGSDSLEPDTSAPNLGTLLLVNGAAFAAALCAVAALGVYRDFVVATVARGSFSAVAVTLASIIAIALLLHAIATESLHSSRASRSLSLAISLFSVLVLPLGAGFLLGMKLLDAPDLVYVIGAGTVLGPLLLWLVWDEVARSEDNDTLGSASAARLAYVPIWGVLVALCGFMFAYQMMQGFGVGIMLLAAWPFSLLALPTAADENSVTSPEASSPFSTLSRRINVAHSLSLLLSIVTVLLLSRLFTTRFRADLRGVGLSDQFALFAFVIGAAFPALLASLWFATEKAKTAGRTSLALPVAASPGRLAVVGLLALALPVAMLAVWGAKVGPALFAGLALSMAGFVPITASRRQPLAIGLFSLAIALTAAQWTHRLAPFAELSRAQRLHILLWALGALVLLALIFDYGSRIASGLRERKDGASVTPTSGVS